MIRCLPLLCVPFLFCGCAPTEARPILRGGTLAIDGDVKIRGSGGGVRLDADRLGLDEDDDELVFEPRVDLQWDAVDVLIEGIATTYSGDGIADAGFGIGPGPPIMVGASVDSELELGLYRLGAAYDLVPAEDLQLAIGLGVGLVDYDLTIVSLSGPGRASGGDELAFPFIHGRAAWKLGRFEPSLALSGGTIEWDDEDITYADIDAALGFHLFDAGNRVQVAIGAGYRYILLDYEFEDSGTDVAIDVDVQGPFAGVQLSIDF